MRFYGGMDLDVGYDPEERRITIEQEGEGVGEVDAMVHRVITTDEQMLKVVEMIAQKSPDFCNGIRRVAFRTLKRNGKAKQAA